MPDHGAQYGQLERLGTTLLQGLGDVAEYRLEALDIPPGQRIFPKPSEYRMESPSACVVFVQRASFESDMVQKQRPVLSHTDDFIPRVPTNGHLIAVEASFHHHRIKFSRFGPDYENITVAQVIRVSACDGPISPN